MDQQVRDIPVLEDPLGQALYLLRLNGSFYCQSTLTAPWGMEMPVLPGKIMFHIVTAGECWLQIEGQPQRKLETGSLSLVPHGLGHRLISGEGAPVEGLFDIPVEAVSERFERMIYGGGGEVCELTCGVLSFDHVAGKHLTDQLPSVLMIPVDAMQSCSHMMSLLDLIIDEARTLKPGGETLITHMADILVILAIRHWLDTTTETQQGWLAALRDTKVGAALTAMHANPANNWTLDSLASEVGMSRSGFAARFTELVGDSPKSYLTRWRMQIARFRLQHQKVPIALLADELGYHSEAAFNRAFKRVMGVTPGSVRMGEDAAD